MIEWNEKATHDNFFGHDDCWKSVGVRWMMKGEVGGMMYYTLPDGKRGGCCEEEKRRVALGRVLYARKDNK